MRKLLVFIAVLIASGFWVSDFVKTGKLEKYLDAHPNDEFNSKLEFYLASTANLANRKVSAEYRYRMILEKYPESSVAPAAWSALIGVIEEYGFRDVVLGESEAFLVKYPDHEKSELIRRKVRIIKYGY